MSSQSFGGRAALDNKCGILIRVAVWAMLFGVVMSIYCDDQNCYDILGYVARSGVGSSSESAIASNNVGCAFDFFVDIRLCAIGYNDCHICISMWHTSACAAADVVVLSFD